MTPVELLCLDCDILADAASSKSVRDNIKNECSSQPHKFRQSCRRCLSCRSDLRTALLASKCSHRTNNKYLSNCRRCFREIESNFPSCEHERTQVESDMNPSAYSLIIMDNYSDKIVFEENYVKKDKDSEPVVHHMLRTLYNTVLPLLEPQMRPKVSVKLLC